MLIIPPDNSFELDGVPLIGEVSVGQPTLNCFQNTLDISWVALGDSNEQVKVWGTSTNNRKEGLNDDYKLLGTFPLNKVHAVIPLAEHIEEFYKIAIEGKYNTVNRWFRK